MHLVVDGRCLHARMGGIGHATTHLIEHLGRSKKSDDLLTVLVGPQAPKLNVPGVTFAEVDAGMIDERFEQHTLPHILELLNVDVYLNMTFSVPALAGKTAQIAVIHDIVFEEKPHLVESRLGAYLRRWSRISATIAHRIVTVSHDARSRIQNCYHVADDRIVVIPNGVKPISPLSSDAISNEIPQRFHIKAPYLLYIGSIEPKKGIDQLLHAFTHPSLLGIYSNLVLAGGAAGPAFDFERKIAEHPRRADIRYLAYVSEQEKHALLAGAHVLAYPSLYEGFGLPPLEALAHGIPCVVNDCTSLPEIVGEVGVIVQTEDRDAFASALYRAATDIPFREWVRKAGPLHVSSFRWDTAANHYWSVCYDAWRDRQVDNL